MIALVAVGLCVGLHPRGGAQAAQPPAKASDSIPPEAQRAAGPWTVTRGTAKPVVEAFTFAACDPTGRFWLKVENGVAGKPAVASAVVRVNGAEVFDPSAFDGKPGTLVRVVLGAAENRVEVQARGAPGGAMELAVWAIQRCLRVELPPLPPGGYMPPSPMRWGATLFLGGRVQSSSRWWVEVCHCASSLGSCPDLDAARIRSIFVRLDEWQRVGGERENRAMAMYCGPDPPPAGDWREAVRWALGEDFRGT